MRVLVGSVLAALLLAAPASADVPVLGASNTVTADRPVSMLVDLKESILLDIHRVDTLPSFKLESGGSRLALVTLRRLGSSPEFGKDHALQFYVGGGTALGWMTTIGGTRSELKAGRYRLYVATDEALKVSVRLPNQAGEATVAPAEHEPAEVRALDPSPVSPPGTVAFGADGKLAERGDVVVLGELAERDEQTPERTAVCLFSGGSPPGGAAAYEPGCPTGSEAGVLRPEGSDKRFVLGIFSGAEPGVYGAGFNFSRVGASPEARGWGVWNPVRPDPEPVVWAPPPPPASPPQPRGTITVPARRLRVRGGRVRVPIRCSAEGPCAGSIALGSRTARFTLPADHAGRVVLRAPRGRRAMLRVITQTAEGATQWQRRIRLVRR